MTVIQFRLTDGKTGRRCGHAALCLDLQYLSVAWIGEGHLQRRFATASQWKAIGEELVLGVEARSLAPTSAIHLALVGTSRQASVVSWFLSADPIEGAPDAIARGLDAMLHAAVAAGGAMTHPFDRARPGHLTLFARDGRRRLSLTFDGPFARNPAGHLSAPLTLDHVALTAPLRGTLVIPAPGEAMLLAGLEEQIWPRIYEALQRAYVRREAAFIGHGGQVTLLPPDLNAPDDEAPPARLGLLARIEDLRQGAKEFQSRLSSPRMRDVVSGRVIARLDDAMRYLSTEPTEVIQITHARDMIAIAEGELRGLSDHALRNGYGTEPSE